jgi:hypothetical protein
LSKISGLSAVHVALIVSVASVFGIWTLLGIYDPSLTGLASVRLMVLAGAGFFAGTMAVFSRLRKKKEEEL